MAQAGYTPIQLYLSTTASAVPSAGNLANGELAINITDGKLFYKDNGGVVQVLATKGAGTIGGSNTQVQYNSSGALAGSANLTFDGTTLTAAGLAGPHNGTVGATTPNTGAFTTLSASSTVSGAGFSTYLASPPAIGGTAANTGAFTTLSASSTVSGAGFSTYLASPPAIGGTAANTGAFTTFAASGAVTLSGGTANGVAYLNASKVLTTGSALTFDGTKLGVDALAVNGNNISAQNSLGFRNRIINGDMRIDQRNAGASAGTGSGTFAYFLDRWVASYSQISKFTVQQNAGGVTPPSGFTNYLGITSSSAYAVAAGDAFNMQQPIEGFNVADLGWGAAGAQSVTVSFWVRSSLTGTFGGAACNSNLTRSYPFTYTISAANTWEQKTVTIAGDTSGTWVTNNGVGLRLYFNLGAGSTYSGTAGAWAGSNFQSATGAVSVVGTSGATFYITGVQLEAGTVATPFERRDYGRELIMCQRYYEKSFPLGVVPSNGASATTLSTDSGSVTGLAQNRLNTGPTVFFKVTKRATPTMQKFGNNSGDWVYALQSSTSWLAGASTGLGRISDSSFMADQQAQDSIAIYLMGHWTASAEL